MALFQHWQNTANDQIKKQPTIFLVIEVIVVIAAVLIIARQGCTSYQTLIQTSENNMSVADDMGESY